MKLSLLARYFAPHFTWDIGDDSGHTNSQTHIQYGADQDVLGRLMANEMFGSGSPYGVYGGHTDNTNGGPAGGSGAADSPGRSGGGGGAGGGTGTGSGGTGGVPPPLGGYPTGPGGGGGGTADGGPYGGIRARSEYGGPEPPPESSSAPPPPSASSTMSAGSGTPTFSSPAAKAAWEIHQYQPGTPEYVAAQQRYNDILHGQYAVSGGPGGNTGGYVPFGGASAPSAAAPAATSAMAPSSASAGFSTEGGRPAPATLPGRGSVGGGGLAMPAAPSDEANRRYMTTSGASAAAPTSATSGGRMPVVRGPQRPARPEDGGRVPGPIPPRSTGDPSPPGSDVPPGPGDGPPMPMGVWGSGGASGNRDMTGSALFDTFRSMLENPGYSAAEKSAIEQEGMNAARSNFASAAGQIGRNSAATGNRAGVPAAYASLARDEARTLGEQARKNQIQEADEAQKRREWASQGMGSLYSSETGYLADLFGLRSAAAGRPYFTTRGSTQDSTHTGFGGGISI